MSAGDDYWVSLQGVKDAVLLVDRDRRTGVCDFGIGKGLAPAGELLAFPGSHERLCVAQPVHCVARASTRWRT